MVNPFDMIVTKRCATVFVFIAKRCVAVAVLVTKRDVSFPFYQKKANGWVHRVVGGWAWVTILLTSLSPSRV